MKSNGKCQAIPLRRRTSLEFLLLILAVLSCAPVEFQSVEVEHAADLSHFGEFQGLKIGVSEYSDPIQSQDTFGTDLFSKGILPILVVIENDTDLAFLVEQQHFVLYPAFQPETVESDETPTTDAVNRKKDSFTDAVVTTSSTAFVAAGVGSSTVNVLEAGGATDTVAKIAHLHIPANIIAAAAMGPLIIGGELSSRDIQITHHMTVETLSDRTLHQGQSLHGFLYFNCDSFDEKARGQVFILRATLQSITDKTVWNVDIPLGWLFPQKAR